jgi:hypothetical protein
MTWLTLAASVIFACLGLLHFAYTLRDFFATPKYFRPVNDDVFRAMAMTRTAIAPQGRDYWSGVLGFNFSHSLGIVMFAALIAMTAEVSNSGLKPALVVAGLFYTAISYWCWFALPTICIFLATSLLTLDAFNVG